MRDGRAVGSRRRALGIDVDPLVLSAWQHTHRLLIESGMAPGAADGALARGIALQAEKFRPAPTR